MKGETAVARVLAERIGLDPTTVGDGLFARALHARMSALGLRHRADYLRLFRESRDEQDALIEEVVVPESWFFRDEVPFRLFRDHVRARWLSEPARAPLRVLSIPCAGGEEPYSIAIALRELGLPPGRWSIVAVDVSRRSLERAARGVYGEHAFRGMDPEHRARYFRAHPKGHELDPTIRASVRFLRGNLLDSNLFRDEPPFDVVLCRNLLIYLDPASRRGALDTFDRLLVPSGLLFLGHAERPETGEARFEPVDEPGSFAYRHVDPSPSRRFDGGQPASAGLVGRTSVCPETKNRNSGQTEVRPTRKRSAAPPIPEIRRNRVEPVARERPAVSPRANGPAVPTIQEKDPSALLVEAAAMADRGETRGAAERCERFLRESGPSAPAYFLLGMIRQAEGDGRLAEECWQKTVYLDPGHEEAFLALALIADRRGDPAAAAGYRRRAGRVRERGETP